MVQAIICSPLLVLSPVSTTQFGSDWGLVDTGLRQKTIACAVSGWAFAKSPGTHCQLPDFRLATWASKAYKHSF